MGNHKEKYFLRNGKSVIIREPVIEDAEAMINLMKKVDTESRFLAREPGEFQTSIEREREIIQGAVADSNSTWFIAEVNGQVVGQCYIGLLRRYQRYRHRAEVAFVLLKNYWNQGIGGKMMQECIKWAHKMNVEKIELDVVCDNSNALKMYESFGFKISGNIHNALKYTDGTYANEYFMELEL